MSTLGDRIGLPHIAPYTAPVGTAPIQIASFGGPFTVINLSTTATVYLSDQAQVTATNSITLFAGQSFVWTNTNPGLYAVASAPGTLVQITDMVRDYTGNVSALATAIAVQILNSGVILVDNPTLIGSGTTGFDTGVIPLPISTYQSIDITCAPSPGLASSVQVTWFFNGTIYAQDNFSCATTDLTILRKKLACRGDGVRVQVGGTIATITVMGSNRPVSSFNQGDISDRVLAFASNGALASGGSLLATPSTRYDGPIMIGATSTGGAAHTSNVRLTNVVSGNLAAFNNMTSIAYLGTNIAALTFPAIAPRDSWTVSLQNGSAGAASVTLYVIAAPEGT